MPLQCFCSPQKMMVPRRLFYLLHFTLGLREACFICYILFVEQNLLFSILWFTESQFTCKTPAIADIVILVDGSWSIGRFNFRLVRLFLENLVTAFNVGSEKTRIGEVYLEKKLIFQSIVDFF